MTNEEQKHKIWLENRMKDPNSHTTPRPLPITVEESKILKELKSISSQIELLRDKINYLTNKVDGKL
jgi:hypothetical protein